MKKLFSLLLFLMISLNLLAQQTVEPVEMADSLRAEGKIYVVVAVVLLILIGVFVYLVRLDGKVTKVEKELKP